MTERYAIADWLTDEQKQRAIHAAYGHHHHYRVPTTEDGYCPLGLAIPETGSEAPSAERVALEIYHDAAYRAGIREDSPEYDGFHDRVLDGAEQFINDWDAGLIPPDQLAIALGVEVLR